MLDETAAVRRCDGQFYQTFNSHSGESLQVGPMKS